MYPELLHVRRCVVSHRGQQGSPTPAQSVINKSMQELDPPPGLGPKLSWSYATHHQLRWRYAAYPLGPFNGAGKNLTRVNGKNEEITISTNELRRLHRKCKCTRRESFHDLDTQVCNIACAVFLRRCRHEVHLRVNIPYLTPRVACPS